MKNVPRDLKIRPDPGFHELHSSAIGFGSKVAVVDSGCARISKVRRKVATFQDFTVIQGSCEDQTEIQHGTTVISLIARYAPGATLLCAKAAADVRGINSIAVIKAMEWSWAQGANVINLSLGFPITGCLDGQCLLCKMVADLSDQGVVVIAAAGNNDDGKGLISCPGVSEHALTVGAVDTDAKPASYSVGAVPGRAKPDVMAPGTVFFDDGRRIEGTSFAAPVVTAAVAILGSQVGYRTAVNILKRTARRLDGEGFPTGYGIIDLHSAWEVAMSDGATGSS